MNLTLYCLRNVCELHTGRCHQPVHYHLYTVSGLRLSHHAHISLVGLTLHMLIEPRSVFIERLTKAGCFPGRACIGGQACVLVSEGV